ncbi:hypothetical protein [Spelaeicoccus albus]|uniref:Gluconate 2-dehydrogenase subunit 3-like protein n=1 Tax=Spelaeicoccus albus TaxID=1280376 RepID=A0A7Z0AA75_9MICO|nr:hypothetical protein [Spelaeicoccus albus]NYI66405.1 hypothetical protein [Spelaeicoccus albus]
MAFPAKYPELNATEMTDEARQILLRVLKVAFPHPNFPDGPYERMADTIMEEAQNSTWFRVSLTQGLTTLGHLAGGDFRELNDDDATKVLHRIETTEFFGFIRRTTVLNLYDNQDAWDVLGYEGPSFDKGGYVNRGFNDLDWLPEPRVETYDGPEELVEFTDDVPLAGGRAQVAHPHVDVHTSSQPGATSTEAGEVRK